MNHKKSMRIFWLAMCLALVAGCGILVTVRYHSYKNRTEGSYENKETNPSSVQAAQSEAEKAKEEEAAASFAVQPEKKSHPSAADSRTEADSRHPVEYRFELKVRNGCLDVYHYHTENLFFHTGIPYHAMSLRQRQELEKGKYFVNEQELYGYLESCTS